VGTRLIIGKAYSADDSEGTRSEIWKHIVVRLMVRRRSTEGFGMQMTGFSSSESNGRHAGLHPHEEAPR